MYLFICAGQNLHLLPCMYSLTPIPPPRNLMVTEPRWAQDKTLKKGFKTCDSKNSALTVYFCHKATVHM